MVGAVNSRSSMTGAAVGGHSSGSIQLQQDPSKDNLLRLSLKPVGCGVYPARITLISQWDVRVLEVEVTAQSTGQACTLELECPARQQVRYWTEECESQGLKESNSGAQAVE